MSVVVGGERYTVGYLDLPTNPKEARFSERDIWSIRVVICQRSDPRQTAASQLSPLGAIGREQQSKRCKLDLPHL